MHAQKSPTGQKLSSSQILIVLMVDNSQLSTHSWQLLLAKICSLILSHTILKGQPHPMMGLCEGNEGWTPSHPYGKDCAGSKAPLQTVAFVNTASEATFCFFLLLLFSPLQMLILRAFSSKLAAKNLLLRFFFLWNLNCSMHFWKNWSWRASAFASECTLKTWSKI